jgi:glutamate-1-semialdehyde aminotransferase
MPFLKFTAEDPRQNAALRTVFYREVLAQGVLLHPRHLWFISYSHSPDDIRRTLAVADSAFRAAAQAAHRI